MSVAGKYQVTIKTPDGETIEGTLTLSVKEDYLEGSLVTGDHRSDFTHGNIMDNYIAWNMVVKTKYVTYPVDCSGNADGKTIKAEIRTKTSGFFSLEGKAI